MKRQELLLSVLMVMLTIIISCNKNDDNPQTVTKKPYAWVAGARDSTGYGMILFSADSGETWVRQGQGSAALKDIDVSDIWAVDENNVWAVCTGNVILRTTDGGNSWTRVQAPANNSNATLMCISIANKTDIWISGAPGIVYNSTDGGLTWARPDSSFFHNGTMQGICAINSQKVYVAGGIGHGKERGFIGFTLDGGSTWDSVFPAHDFNRHEWIGVASSGNTIVVYGGKSYYMVSADGGTTWKNDSVEAGGGGGGAKPDINHLIMLDPGTWWSAFDMDNIYLATNAGSDWTLQQSNTAGYFLVGIDAWDSRLAIVVGQTTSWPPSGPILKTSDGGITWVTKHVCKSNLYKVSFIKQ